ncbi:hypothetical protein HYV64_03420 [Candidatus Shapirobacteria bacterium]|nr:hypothetical protein [Candidatus Shapirobacteria bacterium]
MVIDNKATKIFNQQDNNRVSVAEKTTSMYKTWKELKRETNNFNPPSQTAELVFVRDGMVSAFNGGFPENGVYSQKWMEERLVDWKKSYTEKTGRKVPFKLQERYTADVDDSPNNVQYVSVWTIKPDDSKDGGKTTRMDIRNASESFRLFCDEELVIEAINADGEETLVTILDDTKTENTVVADDELGISITEQAGGEWNTESYLKWKTNDPQKIEAIRPFEEIANMTIEELYGMGKEFVKIRNNLVRSTILGVDNGDDKLMDELRGYFVEWYEARMDSGRPHDFAQHPDMVCLGTFPIKDGDGEKAVVITTEPDCVGKNKVSNLICAKVDFEKFVEIRRRGEEEPRVVVRDDV